MPQTIETQYDDFLAEISSELEKIDPHLAMQIMYYERRFTDVEPQVELHIHYRDDTNLDKKKDDLDSKYGFLMAREGKHVLKAIGLMSLKRVHEISTDNDIEQISGYASCASY